MCSKRKETSLLRWIHIFDYKSEKFYNLWTIRKFRVLNPRQSSLAKLSSWVKISSSLVQMKYCKYGNSAYNNTIQYNFYNTTLYQHVCLSGPNFGNKVYCIVLLYSLCFSPTVIGGALSRDQKLSDHIHWKWAFSLNTSTAKSFASAFQVNMESAPN